MFRYYFLLFLPCLLLACQDKALQLREKRIVAMEASYEKALERYNYECIHQLIVKVRKEGNSPEGLNSIKLVTEVHEKTKSCTNISAYEQYIQTKLQPFTDKEDLKAHISLMKRVANKKIRALSWEKYFLQTSMSSDWSIEIRDFFGSPIYSYWLTKTWTEGQRFEAKLFCASHRSNYQLDSVWVNGVSKKENPFRISLPALRAGKHTIDFKIKYLHKEIPEKDTIIFYTHTFNILPK